MTNAELEAMLEEILVDAYGEDEQLWAFRQAFEDQVEFPIDAFVIGEPVTIARVEYDGNDRRGLTATCRREDETHVVSLADVRVASDGEAARLVAAYRKWLHLDPFAKPPAAKKKRKHKATDDDLDPRQPVELVALNVKDRAIRCRLVSNQHAVTLRPTRQAFVATGEILTVRPKKQWRYGGHPYLSGEIEATRIDVDRLDLEPLRLEPFDEWDPAEEYWGEPDEPIEAWAKPIIEAGKRPLFEMEQVLPGVDADDPFSDPIVESVELREMGDVRAAREQLGSLLEIDLRCLDAHAHLGNLEFDRFPDVAARHYELGYRIGSLSLGEDFNGVLSWGLVDNRPFLRCMHGYALCLWRMKDHSAAAEILNRMLWLNPGDNQGCRFLLPSVRAGERWESQQDHL